MMSGLNRLFPRLLPQSEIIKSCDVDQPAMNFHPLFGLIVRLRFRLLLSLLPPNHVHSVLEIGYGSGLFFPELAGRSASLHGIDVHDNAQYVTQALRRNGVNASLLEGTATALPYRSGSFDLIVAVSCLEYMEPFETVAEEIKRVLRPGGCLVCVTPGNSPVIDFVHDLLTGRKVRDHYRDRRDLMIPTLKKTFVVQQELAVPSVGGDVLTLYRGFRLSVAP